MQVADDFAHLRGQMLRGIRGQRLFRLMQLYNGQVGQMQEVVDGRRPDGDMLVGHCNVERQRARNRADILGLGFPPLVFYICGS